jgi:CheY-like chemotaxis protein
MQYSQPEFVHVLIPWEKTMPGHALDRCRILCVDDSEAPLLLRGHILEMNGYDVETSSSAVKTAHLFTGSEFDLAILDYEMAGMSGGQLAARLKRTAPELKVILYTGSPSLESSELDDIDLLVFKWEGIDALLVAVKKLLPCGFRNTHNRAEPVDVARRDTQAG